MAQYHWPNCNMSEEPQAELPPETAEKQLSPAARRALAEAAARRAEIDARAAALPPENNGRGGLEPARYGDWEIKGLTADF
jgi:hypothetical protein